MFSRNFSISELNRFTLLCYRSTNLELPDAILLQREKIRSGILTFRILPLPVPLISSTQNDAGHFKISTSAPATPCSPQNV